MNHRVFIILMMLLSASWLAACGGERTPGAATSTVEPTLSSAGSSEPTSAPPAPSPTPTEAAMQGTITIWHAWEEAQMPALVGIIDGFRELYPYVQFDVQYVPVEILRQRFEIEAGEGGGPDLLLGPADWGPKLWEAGLVADLSEMAGEDMLAGLNPAGVASGQINGAQVSLPYAVRGVVLYRNKRIIPVTSDTFEALVRQANSATQGEITGAYLERSFFFSGGHLEGIGGSLMDENGQPTFADEQGEAWLNLLSSFEQAGPTDYLTDGDLDLFMQGKAGLIIDGTWNRDVLAEAIGADNLGIDPWPAYGNGRMAGWVQSDNLYLSARSRYGDPELTWAFVRHFLSPEAQTNLAETGLIPAASEAEIVDRVNAQAAQALAGGVAYPVNPAMEFYEAPLDAALRGALTEGLPFPEALSTAEQAVRQTLSGTGPTPTP